MNLQSCFGVKLICPNICLWISLLSFRILCHINDGEQSWAKWSQAGQNYDTTNMFIKWNKVLMLECSISHVSKITLHIQTKWLYHGSIHQKLFPIVLWLVQVILLNSYLNRSGFFHTVLSRAPLLFNVFLIVDGWTSAFTSPLPLNTWFLCKITDDIVFWTLLWRLTVALDLLSFYIIWLWMGGILTLYQLWFNTCSESSTNWQTSGLIPSLSNLIIKWMCVQ